MNTQVSLDAPSSTAVDVRFDRHRLIASVLSLAASGALLIWAIANARI